MHVVVAYRKYELPFPGDSANLGLGGHRTIVHVLPLDIVIYLRYFATHPVCYAGDGQGQVYYKEFPVC